eukprot:TRINITY_DN27464_c0_g1_i2.p1 TRINITY_DN27464_c0_g1~~TRINITY_DN27464_c0_g1_i2.p1  ORF type:complete len:296 (-),score=58.39 TRINITY_DN27464_c0_g1_i2:270-1157(-)
MDALFFELTETINAKLRLVSVRKAEKAFPDGTVPDAAGDPVGKVRVKNSKDGKVAWSVSTRIQAKGQEVMRISCWCGETIDVPHLQVVMDCKDGFASFCADLIPRYDMLTKPEHLCYFDDLNTLALDLRNNPRIGNSFTTGITSLTYRGGLSPVALCGHCSMSVFTAEVPDKIRLLVDTWLQLVARTPVASMPIPGLAHRDRCVRHNYEDLHPLNLQHHKICGPEVCESLKQVMQAFDPPTRYSTVAAPSSRATNLDFNTGTITESAPAPELQARASLAPDTHAETTQCKACLVQ